MAHGKAYREAEKKIEEARRSKALTLYLVAKWDAKDDEKLTELPKSIGNLTQLQSLNLTGNQLTVLPESVGQLTRLRVLDLGGNKLRTLPEPLGQLTQLQSLDVSKNQLTALPESLAGLTGLLGLYLGDNELESVPEQIADLRDLQLLYIYRNRIERLPERLGELSLLSELSIGGNGLVDLPNSLGKLANLRELWISSGNDGNPLGRIPDWIRRLENVRKIGLHGCRLTILPEWLHELKELRYIRLGENRLVDLPASLRKLKKLERLDLTGNPLNPELAAADREGVDAIKAYLRAKAAAQITLNEAKLILVGEGEVGKSCLLGALRGDPFVEGLPTTHGIEIRPVRMMYSESGTEITLNGWDFGGQRVYRPTHQLFFSSPAVYLVVWKPREGPQQGFVKEWMRLIKHREPDAKILVVATHGGPQQRQPDIDRQELQDLFGKDTVLDFFHVDSKPDKKGNRHGIRELKETIARVAGKLPEVGRTVPKSWQDARKALQRRKKGLFAPCGCSEAVSQAEDG